MKKIEAYRTEKEKLSKLFKKVDADKRDLVQGLIEQAAELYADNQELAELKRDHGAIITHPRNPQIQRTTEATKLYLKNANSYAVTIKALNGILQKNTEDEDDEFDLFMSEKKNGSAE